MLTISDGGGGSTPPARKPDSKSSDKPSSKPSSGSRAAAKPAASTPTPATAASTTRPRGTAFLRTPAAADDTKPLLSELLRIRPNDDKPAPSTKPSNTKPTRASGAGKPAPSRPSGGSKPTPSTPSGRGKPAPSTPSSGTSANEDTAPAGPNNGRAERLNDGNHRGTRDTRIRELREEQTELASTRVEIEDHIDEIEEEIKSDESTSKVVGTVANIVTAPVGMVAGLFGRSNPVGDAAENVAGKVLGLEGQRDELETRQSDLAAQEAEIKAQIEQLENEQVLNFMADTAHVVNMDSSVAAFIEDGETTAGNSLTVKLEIADETATGSQGVFDSGTDTITLDSEMVEDSRTAMQQLQRQGIVDGDGNIVDAERFDASDVGDDVIKTVSLVGVHEVNHATQQANDDFEGAFEDKQAIIDAAVSSIPANATPAEAATIVSKAAAEGEAERTRQIEVESYRLQEQNDLRSGAAKKAFITIDEEGTPLPLDEQLENVLAYQEGTPLVHGPTVGYVRESARDDHDDHDHEHDDTSSAGSSTSDYSADGWRGPGWRGPGEVADGWRGPGWRGPGEVAD
jgi:hypothetical protein